MRNFLKISSVFFLLFGLVGCGESSSGGVSASGLTIETQKSEINT